MRRLVAILGIGLCLVIGVGSIAGQAAGVAPFFDHVDEGPDDLRPPPPGLDAFDHAVLEVCGPWGSRPAPARFVALLDAFPDIRAEVQDIAGSLEALVAAWFRADGFVHVFCGEPGARRLGGLHFQGRYLQAQAEGWAGFGAACRIRERDGPIHTFGVHYRTPDGGMRLQCPKGYVLGQSARDLLLAATQAWAVASGASHSVCLAPLEGARRGRAVVVLRDGAIRTYYGDATPDDALPTCG